MKKKILSLMLAMVMMLSLSVTALASTVTPTAGDEKVTLTKTYTITGTAPEETFYLVQTASDVTNSTATSAPDLDYSTVDGVTGKVVASVKLGGNSSTSGTFSIDLPSYEKVGVYTYTLKEVKGSTAGVTYDENEYTLYVYVTNVIGTDGNPTGALQVEKTYIKNDSGEKVESITNTYSAGSLSVAKVVKGALGDTTKKFSFTVTFTAPTTGESVDWSLVTGTVAGSSVSLNLSDSNLTYTFELADGETAEFDNLPDGVRYTVSETAADGYEISYDSYSSGTIANGSAVTTTVTNTATGEVPSTGISLDSLPYIMIIAVVLLGAAYVISRRRLSDRY